MNPTVDVIENCTVLTMQIFSVPRERLFKAWSDPEQLAQWWGPKDFINTFQVFELKPGGNWLFIMHGPDGTEYPNHSTFTKIVVPERIEFDHISGHKFHVTAEFEDLGMESRLTWKMEFEDAEDFEKVKGYVVEGNRQNMERLQEFLETSG